MDGNGWISPRDALQTIFKLNHPDDEGEGAAEGEAEDEASMPLVSSFSVLPVSVPAGPGARKAVGQYSLGDDAPPARTTPALLTGDPAKLPERQLWHAREPLRTLNMRDLLEAVDDDELLDLLAADAGR